MSTFAAAADQATKTGSSQNRITGFWRQFDKTFGGMILQGTVLPTADSPWAPKGHKLFLVNTESRTEVKKDGKEDNFDIYKMFAQPGDRSTVFDPAMAKVLYEGRTYTGTNGPFQKGTYTLEGRGSREATVNMATPDQIEDGKPHAYMMIRDKPDPSMLEGFGIRPPNLDALFGKKAEPEPEPEPEPTKVRKSRKAKALFSVEKSLEPTSAANPDGSITF